MTMTIARFPMTLASEDAVVDEGMSIVEPCQPT